MKLEVIYTSSRKDTAKHLWIIVYLRSKLTSLLSNGKVCDISVYIKSFLKIINLYINQNITYHYLLDLLT